MMAKEVFDMFEAYDWYMSHCSARVTKEDITSKDGRVLSQKQASCLYNYFDLDVEETVYYIKTHTYNEISKTIKKALENREPNYNPHYEDCGDRD